MYATDTRIGRGIMPPGKALRCSLWGQERRFAVPRADRGKGASLFSAHWALWFYSRKTSHREVFLGCAKWKFAGNFFSYKKFPKPQDNLSCGFSLQKALER